MTEAAFDACVARIRSGDKSGLRDIYDAYLDYIYRIIYGVLGRKEDAEDVTSEFFIRFWQRADQYQSGGGHKGFLATMARNMAIDHLRKHRREVLESFGASENEDGPVYEPAAEDDTEAEVIEEIGVKEAISRLDPKEQLIINLKVLSEMTFAEISKQLNIPMGTVTWRYREAIKKLRRYGYYERA
ncbi:MAG: sigma-70 family RNA polymerase sigma factor [Lachnospiraceae bacterium]|nr:sigma-70 family RNA polymerase sigma factor [Lachnospiraceae bacterium]